MKANVSLETPAQSTLVSSGSSPEFEKDKDLIDGCRAGNQQAWDQIVSKYQRLVLSVPLRYGFSREEAEDIAQVTFTILMQSLDNLRYIENIGSWLYTVSLRHSWRAIRRSRRTPTESLDDATSGAARPALGSETISEFDRLEIAEWLNHGLAQLNTRCQELLVALYLDPEEPLYHEIATRLNIPLGSIGPTRARCLQTLRRILTDLPNSHAPGSGDA